MRVTRANKQHSLERLQNYMQDYLGVSELADIFDQSKAAVHMRMQRKDSMPAKLAHLKCGPIWCKADVKIWLEAL